MKTSFKTVVHMKTERHKKIKELIKDNNIETQEELAEALKGAGFDVTQATVSRDIKELNLFKASAGGNSRKYVVPDTQDSVSNEKYVHVLREGFVSMECACNLLVIKTVPGMAMAVCAAVDALELSEVIGTIAGDDTIMAATAGAEQAGRLLKKLSGFVT